MSKNDDGFGKVPKPRPQDSSLNAVTHGETPADSDGNADADLDLGVLGAQLRGLYKELLDQPIPDRFVKLLEELDDKEPGKK
jgi:Anti-sigma factor NepR